MDERTSKSRLSSGYGLAHIGRLLGFLLFTTAGLVAVGAAVLLPEIAAETKLRRDRDILRRQVECERLAALYNQRLIEAIRTDPVVTSELMMRHGNYRPTDARVFQVESLTAQETPAQKLLRMARTPPPPDNSLPVLLGRWIDVPSIKGGVMLLGIGLTACGFVLFGLKRSQDYGPGVKVAPAVA